MAPSTPFRMKTRQHARSISLPSRTHPLLPQFDEHLNRLKETEATSTSLSTLGDRLSGLQDLHVSVDDLLHMPHIQHSLTLVQESNKKLADDVLDKYIKVLDACTATKGIFSQAKYDLQELLSSFRRKKDVTDVSGKYLASRKKEKRTIQMALKDLKNVKISEVDEQLEAINLFNSVQSVTISVLESSLTYIMGTKALSSLVSKLIRKDTNKNEFDQINDALGVLDIESIQGQLGEIEFKIQDIEEGLDCLFKHLIKTRVWLLNMLSY